MHSLEMIIALNDRQAQREREDRENDRARYQAELEEESSEEESEDWDRLVGRDEDYYDDYPEYFDDYQDYPESDLWDDFNY